MNQSQSLGGGETGLVVLLNPKRTNQLNVAECFLSLSLLLLELLC